MKKIALTGLRQLFLDIKISLNAIKKNTLLLYPKVNNQSIYLNRLN